MRTKRRRRKTWIWVTGIIFLLLAGSIGAYFYTMYETMTYTVESMHAPIVRERAPRIITFEKAEPFTVLLLGVDERAGDKGRSDTMIALAVNPEKESIKMLSIPRDTLTEIVGRDTEDKINHAYAFGGVEMSMDTVEKFLDIPIDYYVKVNMEGFQDIVDSVGGVSLNNEMEFTAGKMNFEKGQLNLNGEEALAFVRMRKDDPNGDFGRQTRQRQVIRGVIDKGLSLGSITKFDSIFKALGDNVTTNITLNEMIDIRSQYRSATKNIEQMSIDGSGIFIDNIWYYQVTEEEKQRVQQEFKDHLGLKSDEGNGETDVKFSADEPENEADKANVPAKDISDAEAEVTP